MPLKTRCCFQLSGRRLSLHRTRPPVAAGQARHLATSLHHACFSSTARTRQNRGLPVSTGPQFGSVVDVEVHEIPGDREPDQAEAGKRQRRLVQFGPDPPVRRAPASKCVHADEDVPRTQNNPEDSKTDDPGRKGINRARRLRGLCQNRQPAPEKADKEDADQPHTKPQLALQRS